MVLIPSLWTAPRGPGSWRRIGRPRGDEPSAAQTPCPAMPHLRSAPRSRALRGTCSIRPQWRHPRRQRTGACGTQHPPPPDMPARTLPGPPELVVSCIDYSLILIADKSDTADRKSSNSGLVSGAREQPHRRLTAVGTRRDVDDSRRLHGTCGQRLRLGQPWTRWAMDAKAAGWHTRVPMHPAPRSST